MDYMALYREWRPKTFEDVIGQEHITTTLKNQIKTNKVAHAYLFCGTRGTGKTSSAKVFAKALNCLDLQDGEPCDKCENCIKANKGLLIDLIELDAASNNGVSNIRDIIDEIKYPPQEAKYKVYIMDEVHMLSSGAVNAFLKTLEEPPKHAIFILATTDPQKLPITILSRCQRFDFKRIDKNEIVSRMRKIVTEKSVSIEDKSLYLIAKVCDGAMRDALSILDQAIAMGDGVVEYKSLVSMLGLITNDNLYNIVDAINKKSIDESLMVIEEVVSSGKDMYLFIKEMLAHYRNLLVVKITNNPEEVLDMSEDNIALVKEQSSRIAKEEIMRCISLLQEAEANSKVGNQAKLFLELCVIKMCKIEFDSSPEVIMDRVNRLESSIRDGAVLNQVSNIKTDLMNKKTVNSVSSSKITMSFVSNSWKEITEKLREKRQMVLFASLSTGKLKSCNGNVITIAYDENYKFNKERLDKVENKKIINEIFSEVLMENVVVEFVID